MIMPNGRALSSEAAKRLSNHKQNLKWSTKSAQKYVELNISGEVFRIQEKFLNAHPSTLLGNQSRRIKFYCAKHNDFFFDRHRPSFESIFNYYRYGRLQKPDNVPCDIFLNELNFYDIEKSVVTKFMEQEGFDIPKPLKMPDGRLQSTIWRLFELPESSLLAYGVNICSITITVISIVLFIVETLPQFQGSHCLPGDVPNFGDWFFMLETPCTIWFTAEFALRFYACPSKTEFVLDVKNVVDVVAFMPYYIILGAVLRTFSCSGAKNSASLAFLRVLRLTRIFRLQRYSPGFQVLIATFQHSLKGLTVFFTAMFVMTLLFSSMLYITENPQTDTDGREVVSIPDGFWWAIISMSTVGYGDKVPRTPMGKLIGSACVCIGILTIAIPVSIVSSQFDKFYQARIKKGH